jgi:hypothetical protein
MSAAIVAVSWYLDTGGSRRFQALSVKETDRNELLTAFPMGDMSATMELPVGWGASASAQQLCLRHAAVHLATCCIDVVPPQAQLKLKEIERT